MALFNEERLRHLRVLGLKFDATEDDIKKTYKKLALKYHPDKCHNDPSATNRFQELSAAYYGLKKLIEKERKRTCCSCGFHHCEDESDCSDYYDSDDEGHNCSHDDEELLDFFRRIFMDVFSEFVFRKKFQSKRRRRDTFTVEEDEEESFFEFLSKKFHSEGRSKTDDYVLTEEDLKKFQSYDDWQKARDPSKPHNRCKRRAIQKSKRRQQKEEQKQLNKKQLKTEHMRKEKELKEIRDQLLRNLDEKKEKEQQKIQKAKNKVAENRSKGESRALKSPERLEIEEQLVEARKKEIELQENLRILEAKELKKEKKLRKIEKKKAKKQQSEARGAPSFQLKTDDYTTYKLFNQDFADTKYDKKNISNNVSLDSGYSRPVSNHDRDKGLQELMDRVKKNQKYTRGGHGDAPEVFHTKQTDQRITNNRKTSYAHSAPADNSSSGSQKLREHLEAYHELMKLQPKRHTEHQLREERTRIRDAQLRTQQHELDQLRNDPANRLSEEDHSLRREEFLRRQRERERLRNEQEALEISKESYMRRYQSAPAAPVSRKYYESISYQEKHAQFEHPIQPRPPAKQIPRSQPVSVPVVENPIKREIPNPESTWSRVVNSETPWGQRSRKQLEIKTLLPHNEDEEEEMLQQALALSVETAQVDSQRREHYYDHQAEIDRRVMEAAASTRKLQHYDSNKHNQLEQRPPISKYPLSDKFKVYPGCDGSLASPIDIDFKPQPTMIKSNNKSEVTKMCRPHPSKKNMWSLCPGKPTEDDWSFSPCQQLTPIGIGGNDCLQEPSEDVYQEEEEELHVTRDVVVVNSKWKDAANKDLDYSYQNNVDYFTSAAHTANGSHLLSNKFVLDLKSTTLPTVDAKPTVHFDHQSNAYPQLIDCHGTKPALEGSCTPLNDGREVQTERPFYPAYKSVADAPIVLQYEIKTSVINDARQPSVHLPPTHKDTMLNQERFEHQTQEGRQTIVNNLNVDVTQEAVQSAPPEDYSRLNQESFLHHMPKEQSALKVGYIGLGNVGRREAETNTEPVTEPQPPPHPQMHDSFTQTKVSTGFVGGYWDSSSNNREKIPVLDPPQPSNIPDPRVIEKIPAKGIAPPDFPRGPQTRQSEFRTATSFQNLGDHNGPHNIKDQGAPPDKGNQCSKIENWDENLIETFSTMNMDNPCAGQRGESSIAVNTSHDYSTIPRLPFVPAVELEQPAQIVTLQDQQRMTDDQKLSDQHLTPTNHDPQLDSNNSDETDKDSVNAGKSVLPCELPEGLPPHLIQAYMEYVSANSPNTHVHKPQEPILPDSNRYQEAKEQVSSLPNPAAMRPFAHQGQPGFMPPVWSPLFPWMLAGPMVPQPMMPFCPSVFAYSLQQQMDPKDSNTAHEQLQLQAQTQTQTQSQSQPLSQPKLQDQHQPQHHPELLALSQPQLHPQTQPSQHFIQQNVARQDQNNSAQDFSQQNSLAADLGIHEIKLDAQPSNYKGIANQEYEDGPSSFSPASDRTKMQQNWREWQNTVAPEQTGRQNRDSGAASGTHHYQHSHSQRYIRPTLPPRFRQKRLELKKKIQTFISEIKKDGDEYIQTEIGDEENRISA